MSVHRKDLLWKGVLEWVYEDLLRFVFPNAARVFDLDRGFRELDKELQKIEPEPDQKMDVRIVDKLIKVLKKGSGDEWVLIHIEV